MSAYLELIVDRTFGKAGSLGDAVDVSPNITYTGELPRVFPANPYDMDMEG